MMIRSTRNWLQTDQILTGVDGPLKSLIGDQTLSGLDERRVVVAKRPLGWILLRLTRRSSAAATDKVPASLARVQRQVEADGWTVAAQYRGWPSPTALTRLRSPRMKLAEVLRDEDSDSAIERPTFVGEIFL